MMRPRRLFQILTLRCAGATELASHELDEPLEFPERLALKGHLLVCDSCRRFRSQIRFLRDVCRLRNLPMPEPEASIAQSSLSDEARARIARALREATGDDSGDRTGLT